MAAFFVFAPANHCTFEPCQSWQWATFLMTTDGTYLMGGVYGD